MNELTKKYRDDVLPYLKPEYREAHEKRVLKHVNAWGNIVKIEDKHGHDGQSVIERTYYHENGRFGVLNAAQAGVESLPT
jgi:hypothetical protein